MPILAIDRFGTIQNNTTLKPIISFLISFICLGTIQNNTTLKHKILYSFRQSGFGNHSK